ncbi:ER membrane protein SH3-domain-containing protein [Kockovaella imperatae]|uniref:ER membrane protein SH3-domain-containing protein n=1 Tax=Kockovaella imperatae TaxID=4999 RepID=A0A1Y1UEH8_9TREE|nr:ER membrane protein SH3-domain-containing protein [Kockovaella imperatae]ORX36453.1 ER membrane protein SH3-domain-containing protein [Kockovaella imperatae]
MVWRTTAITLSTCFLLGTTFTHWIADHNVLWRSPLTSEALSQSISYYALLANAPKGLEWVYFAAGAIALICAGGRMVKDWRGRHGEVLFDGGSLVLLGAIAYNQLTELAPTLALFPLSVPTDLPKHSLWPVLVTAVRDLANDNVITAVMLTGVMLLQAGRYHAKKKSPIPSTPTSSQSPAVSRTGSPLLDRKSTPYRELTEQEAFELRADTSDDDSGSR